MVRNSALDTKEVPMYSKSIQNLIQERVSTRSYDKLKPVEKEKQETLIDFCANLGPSPFGDKVRFFLSTYPEAEKTDFQISTYGSIKNASLFILGSILQSERCFESFGYLFEQVILKATDLGIATCWLGYFTLPDSILSQNLRDKEIIPALSPIGYPSGAPVTRDFIVRRIFRKTKRKSFSDLFFQGDFQHPLDEQNARIFASPLEMVRSAPSAGNRQPIRVILDKDTLHFYIDLSHVPDQYKKRSLHLLDLGIALSHFELTCTEQKIRGQYISVNKDSRPAPAKHLHYGISWKNT
jgi:hypothetical protein